MISPTEWWTTVLETSHEYLHLPWWGSIAVVACLTRLIMAPLVVRNMRNAPKMAKRQEEMKILMQEANAAKQMG